MFEAGVKNNDKWLFKAFVVKRIVLINNFYGLAYYKL